MPPPSHRPGRDHRLARLVLVYVLLLKALTGGVAGGLMLSAAGAAPGPGPFMICTGAGLVAVDTSGPGTGDGAPAAPVGHGQDCLLCGAACGCAGGAAMAPALPCLAPPSAAGAAHPGRTARARPLRIAGRYGGGARAPPSRHA